MDDFSVAGIAIDTIGSTPDHDVVGAAFDFGQATGRFKKLNDTYRCVSSAYNMQSNPWAVITSSSGAKKSVNRTGPKTEPRGTP